MIQKHNITQEEQAPDINEPSTDSRRLLNAERIFTKNIAQQATATLRPAVTAAFHDSLYEFDSLYRELAKWPII